MEHLPFLTRDDLKFGPKATIDLEIDTWSNTTVIFEVVGFTKDGPFTFQIIHAGDLALETNTFRIPDIPIMVALRTANDTVLRGDAYHSITLRINGEQAGLLASGYVSRMKTLQWPGNEEGDNLSGRGLVIGITGTNPAANTEISETVPANRFWKIHGILYTLVTDANAATREVLLEIGDGSSLLHSLIPFATQTQGLTRVYSWVPAGTSLSGSHQTSIAGMLPLDLLLPEGFTIVTNTANRQVGDDFSAPLLYVEQWITP